MLYASMHDLIGNTPLVRLAHLETAPGAALYAKLELYNPSGSAKDRTALYMVESAEKRGDLRPGGTIVLGTAGNTGLGFAFAALNRGYRVIFAVPQKFSVEKQILMHALGAEIVHTPLEEGMIGANRRAAELAAQIPGAVVFDQFSDPGNPRAHFEQTGPEIHRDLDGHVDYFVAGAGTGGTFSGIAAFLKKKNPAVKAVLADPVGSTLGGGTHADYRIEGIGNDFVPQTLDMSLVDTVYKVTDEEAFGAVRTLARREGIFAGSSSGAGLAAAWKLIADGAKGNIVVVFPDRGDRYFSKKLYESVE